MGLNLINASDGGGEAVRATITTIRSPGSTVNQVDSVTNWPAHFIATSGKELADGTLDPATILVYAGHTSGSTVVIDTIAPGYSDTNGNAVDDIILIKPSTMWADQIATLLGVIMNDDGTLKNNAVTTASIANSAVTSAKLSPTKSVDANGWTVMDMGTWKRYSKRVTFSQTVAANSIAALTVSSTNFPSGITTLGTRELIYQRSLSVGFGADSNISVESLDTAASTSFTWSVRNNSSSSRTFTGFIDIAITER